MFKFNNRLVPNKVHIGWHFSSNKYVHRDAYSALKSLIFYSFVWYVVSLIWTRSMVPTVTFITLYGMVVIMYLMAAGATWIFWRGI